MIRIKFSELKIGDTFMDNFDKKLIKTPTVSAHLPPVKINCVLLAGDLLEKHPRGTLMWNDPDELINKIEEE